MLSLATAKTLLRLTSTDANRDALIALLLPIVYEDIVGETNNFFRAPGFTLESDLLYFDQAGTVYTLNLVAGGFAAMGWVVGGNLVVSGSRLNDGFYTIQSISDQSMQVVEAMVDEIQPAPGIPIKVGLSVFPKPIDMIAARMIGYLLNNMMSTGIVGEHIGDYSYTRARADKDAGYPGDLLKALQPWKFHTLGKGTVHWHVNENRTWMRFGPSGSGAAGMPEALYGV
jgi:hypothetical protein